MTENTITGNAENGGGRHLSPWRIAAWTAAALVLLLPLVAMQFTDEVNWTASDFVFAGALILGVGVTYEFAARKTGDTAYRTAVGVALAAAFLLIWVNGAVGIIGSENNPANLMYGGVLAVGIVGTLIARFQPQGMARTLFMTTLAQVLVPVIALIIWKPPVVSAEDVLGVIGVFALNGFFAALWVGSALLFRKAAAREQPPVGAKPEA